MTGCARHKGLTLVEVLVLLVVLGVLVGLLLGVWTGREEARQVHCVSNLTMIYISAMNYSEKIGNGKFPLAPGPHPRAHESLNELIAFQSDGLAPSVFVCPSSDAVEAAVDEEGYFRLDPGTLSYAWTTVPLRNVVMDKPLAADKYVDGYEDEGGRHRGHPGGVNQLMTTGSVLWVPTNDLPPRMLPRGLGR